MVGVNYGFRDLTPIRFSLAWLSLAMCWVLEVMVMSSESSLKVLSSSASVALPHGESDRLGEWSEEMEMCE